MQTWLEELDKVEAASSKLEKRQGNPATPDMQEMSGEGQSNTGWSESNLMMEPRKLVLRLAGCPRLQKLN